MRTVAGITRPGTFFSRLCSRSRASEAICSGWFSTGFGQDGNERSISASTARLPSALASGDDGEIVLRQRVGQRLARNDVERRQRDIRALEQEFERRVVADVARRGKRQKPQRRLRGAAGRVKDLAQHQRLALARDAIALIAEELLDGREIHQRCGVVRLEDIFVVTSWLCSGAEIDAVESELREFRDAERLVRRLLPEKIAHAALTR